MTAGQQDDWPRPPRGRLRSAAWVLGLALLISTALFVSHVLRALRADRPVARGDGRDPATYGFVLEPCLVPRATLVAAGLPRDGLPALDHPRLATVADVDSLNAAERGKYLVPDDRVIGLELGGVARAYPLRVLNWHEVVNDTVGGRPVAVTFGPLADACAVFDRRVDGQILELGFSGLLHDSCLLMYDRRPDGEEVGASLWSQVQARAVTGPAAATSSVLDVLPCAVTTWGEWRARHPDTTVPFPEPERRASYKRDPYGSYHGSDLLRFPVASMPPVDGPRAKQHVAVLRRGGSWTAFLLDELAARAGPDGHLELPPDGDGPPLRLRVGLAPARLEVRDADGRLQPSLLGFWFAWHATRPEIPLTALPRIPAGNDGE